MRWGITIPLEGFHNQRLLELVRRAEELGYSDAWSAESSSADAFSPLAAAAAVTSKMRLGTAIVPVFTRPPALIAMSAATVQQISGGRLALGVGTSTPIIVEQWMGIPFQKPVARLRETVAALRAVLAGDKVSIAGPTVRINGFRLDLKMDSPPPPIFVAAQGGPMLRVAGEIGDGMLTNFVTPEGLSAMLKRFEAGARAAGKDPARMDVVCRIVTIVDEDERLVMNEMRRSLAAYVAVPQYNRFFAEFGFESEAAAVAAAWNAGDRKRALQLVPDRMVKSIYVFGSADYCRHRLEEYGAAGVKTAAILLNSFAPTPQEKRARILRALEKLAPR